MSNVVDALNDVLNTENPVPVDDFATALDAGGTLTITGPNGQRVLTNSSGAYAGLLGGIDLELNEAPLYFVQGPYSIAGQGGADVEAFNAQFNLGDPLTLSNSEQLVEVNRNNGFTIRWQGGERRHGAGCHPCREHEPRDRPRGSRGLRRRPRPRIVYGRLRLPRKHTAEPS